MGVRFVQNGATREARCQGEVVLCAGAVQSPHVLEISGIGQPELLRSFGVEPVHELPGVGENYRDHYAPRMNWRVKLPITLNEQTRGLSFAREIAKYFMSAAAASSPTPPASCSASSRPALSWKSPTRSSTSPMPATATPPTACSSASRA